MAQLKKGSQYYQQTLNLIGNNLRKSFPKCWTLNELNNIKEINATKFVEHNMQQSFRKFFWVTVVPCGSEVSHNVEQLNPNENKFYLSIPYPTLMPLLKKFSLESIFANARNPNIDLQSKDFIIPYQIYNIIFEQKSFKNLSLKWIQSRDNQPIKTYEISLKQKDFQISTDKKTVDILKTLKVFFT